MNNCCFMKNEHNGPSQKRNPRRAEVVTLTNQMEWEVKAGSDPNYAPYGHLCPLEDESSLSYNVLIFKTGMVLHIL